MKNSKYAKEILSLICMIGVFFGISISREIAPKYGNNGTVIIAGICIIIVFAAIIISAIVTKKFINSFIAFFGFGIPMSLIFISLYLDNIFLMLLALSSIFIIMPITKKLGDKYCK
ncbi:hypothetical protein [Inconstantimicrobium mannanitabidum]|uniref:Uncharacterized protein n=1 Tax=Inconstantimicrobium mannanitabidum TaxID=1604901 RepID=A0ACB5RHR1_9CLOT|nr:hypothetical protein [Clostridium sp. TW13]GKX68622.1 hypothetical protein rsdtw13_38800 [Clostridium sp. TW13]